MSTGTNRRNGFRWLRRSRVAVVAALLGLTLLLTRSDRSWSLPNTARQGGIYAYGPDSFIDFNNDYEGTSRNQLRASPLKNATPLVAGLGSGVYMNSVGGIAFDKPALPAPDLTIDQLELTYNRRPANDGQRLIVRINDRPLPVSDLYDWMLVPLAKYADSPYFALVTLHGKLIEGQTPPPEVAAHHGYVIALHPALEHTTLGMRMFNADYMLLDPAVTGELPRQQNRYVLGRGEKPPVTWQWSQASVALNDIFRQATAASIRFQSYVICDANVQPTFQVRGNQLQLSGEPYFYFWCSGDQETVERIVEDGQQVLVRSRSIVPLPQLSDAVSQRVDLLLQANPAVYTCLVKTMRYAAFFRYCKRKDLEMWNRFMQQLQTANPADYRAPMPVVVRTPNPQPRVIMAPGGMQ